MDPDDAGVGPGRYLPPRCASSSPQGLSSPRPARRATWWGGRCVLATVIVFTSAQLATWADFWSPGHRYRDRRGRPYRVQMTTDGPAGSPCSTAWAGGAAAIVALIELDQILFRLRTRDVPDAAQPDVFTLVLTAFTLLVGAASFAGSIVTFLKLQELMTTRPVTFPGYPLLYGLGLLAALGFTIGLILIPTLAIGVLLQLVGAGIGFPWCSRSGGADVPIVISLLTRSRVTVAASGYLENTRCASPEPCRIAAPC